MIRKPDRFEQMVQRVAFLDSWNMPVVSAKDALKLLRAEHRRVVREVKKLQAVVMNDPSDWSCGYDEACKDILAALTRLKGGRG